MRQHTEILASPSQSVNDYDTFQGLIPSFQRNLRAINRAPKTIATYLEALRQFAGFVQASGMPDYPALITREHIEHFIVHLQDRGLSSAMINNRFRGLQSFFKWMVEVEGDWSCRFRRPWAARLLYYSSDQGEMMSEPPEAQVPPLSARRISVP